MVRAEAIPSYGITGDRIRVKWYELADPRATPSFDITGINQVTGGRIGFSGPYLEYIQPPSWETEEGGKGIPEATVSGEVAFRVPLAAEYYPSKFSWYVRFWSVMTGQEILVPFTLTYGAAPPPQTLWEKAISSAEASTPLILVVRD